MAKNIFDTFLESLSDEGVRRGMTELAQKEPKLKDAFMAQSDYSRKLDENRKKLEALDGWDRWREENWITIADGKGMTKAEKQAMDRLATLEAEKQELERRITESEFSTGGDEVTFEQLQEQLDAVMKQRNIIDDKRLDEVIKTKTTEVEELVRNSNRIIADAAFTLPYLNQKHQQQFGELFDPQEFVKAATEAGQYDFKKFYESWTAPKRAEKERADFEAKLAAQDEKHKTELEAARQEAVRARAMSPGSEGMPIDTEGGTESMSSFQKKYLGLVPQDEGTPKVPDSSKLGDLSASAIAAREYARKSTGPVQ